MPSLGRWLVRDSRARTLAAALPFGRGRVARSLVADTWRWLQGGHPDDFARYWSTVLSAVARPATTARGQWNLEDDSGAIFAGEPVRISWRSEADAALPGAEVRTLGQLADVIAELV